MSPALPAIPDAFATWILKPMMLNGAVDDDEFGSVVPPPGTVTSGALVAGVTLVPPSARTSRRMRNPRRSATTATAAPRLPLEADGSEGRDPRGRCWLIRKGPPYWKRRYPHRSGRVCGVQATTVNPYISGKWSRVWGLNPRPTHYKCVALPLS